LPIIPKQKNQHASEIEVGSDGASLRLSNNTLDQDDCALSHRRSVLSLLYGFLRNQSVLLGSKCGLNSDTQATPHVSSLNHGRNELSDRSDCYNPRENIDPTIRRALMVFCALIFGGYVMCCRADSWPWASSAIALFALAQILFVLSLYRWRWW